jgi:catechol 2,3-dioxygenase-like lactoylglutathione lyase family enzyme
MAYHHLAMAARDMQAIHAFYEECMGFELVKVEIGPVPEGGWAKHFFYRMNGDNNSFIAFWEMHDVPGADAVETNLSKAAGVPDQINHIAFRVDTLEALKQKKDVWLASGIDVLEIDHNWCHSIYTKDPNDNLVEFCVTTGSFDEADRKRALEALTSNALEHSKPPANIDVHRAASS